MSAVTGMFFNVLLKKGHPDSLGHSVLGVGIRNQYYGAAPCNL